MIKKVSIGELERVCEFLELDFRILPYNTCTIQWPFEGCPIDEFTIINNEVYNGTELAKKIAKLREYREKAKILQNEIKALTKG